MAAARNQPQYDFITGSPPPASETFRSSHLARPDPSNEDLRAQIHKLQYDVESLKQEREATALRHQEDLRSVQSRADADFARTQASESAKVTALSKLEALAQDLQDLQDQSAKDKRDLDRKLRAVQDENGTLLEELEELKAEMSSRERQWKHDFSELESKHNGLQQALEDLRADRDEKATAVQKIKSRLSDREADIGEMENEILRLKTQTGDVDTLAVIKRELSEQVAHIMKLEATTRDQHAELKQYRRQQKAIEIVEEEKRMLESKVRLMNNLRKELGETQLQRQILEDERKSWSAYLENTASTDEELRFDTPEDLARAYIQERLEKATLVDELGKVSPDLSAKDAVIQSLEEQTFKLNDEMEKLRLTAKGPDTKAQTRLERQRILAVKEVEYLRAQLKMFDTEEGEFEPEKHDDQKTKRIQELEDVVDQYRKEVQTLHTDLAKAEKSAVTPQPQQQNQQHSPTKASKRPHDTDSDDRPGEFARKNRALQDDLSKVSTAKAVLEKDLAAAKSQLAALKAPSRTRILELRTNPTAAAETLKLSTLATLRAENAALLTQLEARHPSASASADDDDNDDDAAPDRRPPARAKQLVPQATLDRLRADMAAQEAALASRDKHMLRLKQVFAAKSQEIREAVASVLGWKLDFMPNGRVRVTSMFHPGSDGGGGDGDGENSIVFDGEQGTMKVSGGPQSAFAGEIRGLIEFWVEGRKEIPCFLAACTLEFWERSTRALKM